MRKALCGMASLCALLLTISAAVGQVATGVYLYGTFDSPGIDTINVGNLNIQLTLPVLNKTGRGLPFSANLTYESSVYYPAAVGSSEAWTPVQQFPGWYNTTGLIFGHYTYSSIGESYLYYENYWDGNNYINVPVWCYYTEYNNWVYTDASGQTHPFGSATGTLEYDGQSSAPYTYSCPSDTPNGSGVATDGSGYQISISNYTNASASQTTGTTTVSTNGTTATETDSNGNEISTDGQGNYTDTTGHVVLRVTGNTTSSQIYTYYDTGGNARQVSVNYSAYTVQTAFGCSGIGEYGPTVKYLVSSITYPDGSEYQFKYETTPGNGSAVTGRIAGIELPQGGWINYTYTGGNNGIECADGSAAGLTRTISGASGSAPSTWTYTRTITGTATSQTTVVDGLDNSKVYNFVEPSNEPSQTTALYYETSRSIYQGSASGTPVIARTICYNESVPYCPSSPPSLPFGWIDTYQTVNGVATDGSTIYYLVNGGGGTYTQVSSYDYGTGGARGGPLRTTSRSYTSSTPYVPSADNVSDGGGNSLGQTLYNYDGSTPTGTYGVPQHVAASGPRRNLTSLQQYVNSGTGYTAATMTYYDTGQVLTSSTNPSCTSGPNCVATSSYDSTYTYVTGTTAPIPTSGVGLDTSASYDTTYTGVLLTSTDANGQVTTMVSYDSMLRPTQEDFPDGGKTTWSWSPTEVVQNTYQTSGTFGEGITFYDSYGRPSRTAVADGSNGGAPWYLQDTCYDANGNVAFQSYRYSSSSLTGSPVCSGSGGDTYSYDVLGRVTSIVRGNGETRTYSYLGRATKAVDENGVTRISQVDGLGRTTIVCEISSNGSMPGGSGSPASCGTDIAGTGFTTLYGYGDTLVNGSYLPITTVTQGGQTRTFETDWLGRPLSTTEPESGTTTYSYSYNSTGLVTTRQKPQANQTNPSVLTTTTTQYDILGRPISVSYNDGVTPTKNFAYDAGASWSGYNQQNIKGRLSEAYTGSAPAVNGYATTIYGYDSMGRTNLMGECTPSICGSSSHQLNYTYDLAGDLLTSSDGAGVTTTYTVSPAAEVLSITSSLNNSTDPPNLLSSASYGPDGPTGWTLGNQLTGQRSYDSLGRVSGGGVNMSRGPEYGFGTTWKGSQLQSSWDNVQGGLGVPTDYGYDQFNRLVSQTAYSSGMPNLSWVYDRWGNRWSQTVTKGSGPQTSLTFNPATNQINTSGYSYDAAGNLLSDGLYSYTYDAEGNITADDNGDTYTYDALGQRVAANANQWTEFVFNFQGQRVSEWYPGNHSEQEGIYYWGNTPLAFYTTTANPYGAAVHFEHRDWLGTERMRTSYNGNVEATFTSLPYGDAQTQTSGSYDLDQHHFAQTDYDAETNTDHAEFRQYSPALGSWMRPDPYAGSYDISNPQSLNRYEYALDNPVSNVDPSGLDCVSMDEDGDEFPNYDECVESFSPVDILSALNVQIGGAASVQWEFVNAYGIPLPGAEAEFLFESLAYNDAAMQSEVSISQGSNAAAPNNGTPPTVSHCLGVAAKAKGLSIGLDVLGSIPAVGNAVSAGAGIVRAGIAVNHVITSPAFAIGSGVYGAYGGVTAGPGEATDSLVGSASAGTGIGLALADASLEGTKAIPIIGNIVSAGTLAWDGYQAYQKYQSCMAGH